MFDNPFSPRDELRIQVTCIAPKCPDAVYHRICFKIPVDGGGRILNCQTTIGLCHVHNEIGKTDRELQNHIVKSLSGAVTSLLSHNQIKSAYLSEVEIFTEPAPESLSAYFVGT